MLIAEQRSALSGFTYDLASADGTVIGELCFPDWAQARNARLKNPAPQRLRSSIDLRLSGAAYTIEFEYTRRGWHNGTRFELQRDGQALGLVHEPDAFNTRRQLCAELPADVPPPVQGFLLFLVINLAFG